MVRFTAVPLRCVSLSIVTSVLFDIAKVRFYSESSNILQRKNKKKKHFLTQKTLFIGKC